MTRTTEEDVNTTHTTAANRTLDAARRERIRVPVEMSRGLVGKAITWWSRRAYGDVLDPALVLDHHRKILFATMGFERKVEKWDEVELTKMVSVENERSRFNSAMGLSSQGLSDRCELPPRTGPAA